MLLSRVLTPKQAPRRQSMMKTNNYQAGKVLSFLVSGRSLRKLGRYRVRWFAGQAHSIPIGLMIVESSFGCTMIERGGQRHQLLILSRPNQHHIGLSEFYVMD